MRGTIYGDLGILWKQKNDPQKAIIYHEQYRAIARQDNDVRGEIAALEHLGQTYEDIGEGDQARIYWHEATRLKCRLK